jgi:hypothetical protein
MARTFSTLICAALLLGAPVAAAETLPAPHPAAYPYQDAFPGQVAGAGFEIPRQTFLDLLAAQGLTYRTNTAADVVAVATNGAAFTEVVYFFNSDACDCLTEIEIRFADETSAAAYFNTKFPSQDIQGEYFGHDGVSLYRVNAWRFKSKVYLVAILPNTRWSNQ